MVSAERRGNRVVITPHARTVSATEQRGTRDGRREHAGS